MPDLKNISLLEGEAWEIEDLLPPSHQPADGPENNQIQILRSRLSSEIRKVIIECPLAAELNTLFNQKLDDIIAFATAWEEACLPLFIELNVPVEEVPLRIKDSPLYRLKLQGILRL